MPMEMKQITGDDLKLIFGGRNFLTRLKTAEKITRETDCEVPFSIYRGVRNNKFIFTPIPESDQGMDDPFGETVGGIFPERDYLEGLGYDPVHGNDVYLVASFHTHPRGKVCPSEADFNSHQATRQWFYDHSFNIFPISVIAGVAPKNETLDGLLFQDLNETPHRSLAKDAFDRMDLTLGGDWRNNESVAAAIAQIPNYYAALVRYQRIRSHYGISSDQLSKLERFAFIPQPVKRI